MEKRRRTPLVYWCGVIIAGAVSALAGAGLPGMFYGRYEGTIAVGKKQLPIVMNLHKQGEIADGCYYYRDRGILIELGGSIDGSGKVNLSEYAKNKLTGIFAGEFTDRTAIEGVWNDPAGSTNAVFSLAERYPEGSVKADMKRLYREKAAYVNMATATLEYPVISGVSSQLVLRRIHALIRDGISPEAALENNLNSLVSDMKNTYMEDEVSPNNWYYLERITVAFNGDGVLGLQSYLEEYSGGAHPNYSVVFTNINATYGTIISLADILASGYEDGLKRTAEELFRKAYDIGEDRTNKTYDDAGFWLEPGSFSLPENFLITPAGLLFLFNPYEIAPHAAGTIEFLVPYSTIRDLIKPGSVIETFLAP